MILKVLFIISPYIYLQISSQLFTSGGTNSPLKNQVIITNITNLEGCSLVRGDLILVWGDFIPMWVGSNPVHNKRKCRLKERQHWETLTATKCQLGATGKAVFGNLFNIYKSLILYNVQKVMAGGCTPYNSNSNN